MGKIKNWKSAGLRIDVDDNNAVITDRPYGSPPAPSGYKIVRPLANFEVKIDDQHKSVQVTFTACYKPEDVTEAGGVNKLKLKMFDKDQQKWKNVPLTGDAQVPAGWQGFQGAKEAKLTARWPDSRTETAQ